MPLDQALPAAQLLVQTTSSNVGTPISNGATGGISYDSVFPLTPANGATHVLVDSKTNPSWQWLFRYNNLSSSNYKWEFLGGAPLTAASSSVFLPFDGDWVIWAKGGFGNGGTTTGGDEVGILAVNSVTLDTATQNGPSSAASGTGARGAAAVALMGKTLAATAGQTVGVNLGAPVISILPVRLR